MKKIVLISIFCLILISNVQCSKDHRDVGKYYDTTDNFYNIRLLGQWAKNHTVPNSKFQQCLTDLDILFEAEYNDELWAMDMDDSWGSESYGILTGNWNFFGQRSQCLAIKYNDLSEINGKYCISRHPMSELIREKIIEKYGFRTHEEMSRTGDPEIGDRVLNTINRTYVINYGICIPHSCSAEFIESIININLPVEEFISIPENLCDTGEAKEWDSVEIGILTFFCCFGVVIILSTAYDVWFVFYRKDDGSKDKQETKRAFSVYTNTQKMLVFGNSGQLGCLDGIKAISIMWIVLAHRYDQRNLMAMENYLQIYTWAETYRAMLLIASTVSVDSFFVVSGILVSYLVFRMKGAGLFLKNLHMYYIHRYLRLTPVLGFTILLYAGFAGRMYFGPLKEYFTLTMQDYCRINWWTNLLYVQNYVDTDQICISQTWYLSIDMQLYFIAGPLIIIPILWKPVFGTILLGLWVAVFQAITIYVAYDGGWYGGMLTSDPNNATFRALFYVPSYTRAVPWLLGMCAGYFFRTYLNNQKGKEVEPLTAGQLNIRRLANVVCWITALGLMAAVLFGMQPLQQISHEYQPWGDVMYNSFNRTAWAVALILIIGSCFFGYGGFANWFLSLTPLRFINRISYCLYLIHKLIQSIHMSMITQVSTWDHFVLSYEFLGDMVAAGFMAYIMYIVVETPFATLEKKLLPSGGGKANTKPPPKPVAEPTPHITTENVNALQGVQVTDVKL